MQDTDKADEGGAVVVAGTDRQAFETRTLDADGMGARAAATKRIDMVEG